MNKKNRIGTAVISLMLIFAMVAGCFALMTGCSETDIRMSFRKRGSGDVMYIGGREQKKIPNELYDEMFDCVKDLNKIKNRKVDTKYLGRQIYKAKEAGTYIHLGQKDGKYVTYVKYRGFSALWGEIPDRTNATGKITKGEAYYYNITPQVKAEIKKAEDTAAKNRTDRVIPK